MATRAKRPTARQAFDSQPQTALQTKAFDCLISVLRTGRRETAAFRQVRRNALLVPSNQAQSDANRARFFRRAQHRVLDGRRGFLRSRAFHKVLPANSFAGVPAQRRHSKTSHALAIFAPPIFRFARRNVSVLRRALISRSFRQQIFQRFFQLFI